MRSPQEDILDRWLTAENAELDGRADEAEAALMALFATLPPLVPPAGFADRVMLRAGMSTTLQAAPRAVPRSVFASLWVRAGLTLCLLAVCASVLWLPQALRAVAGLLSVANLVRLWTASVVAVCRWLGSALGLWDFL